jgi:hypothetical protein
LQIDHDHDAVQPCPPRQSDTVAAIVGDVPLNEWLYDHLVFAAQPPQSPHEWERWWRSVTRKAIVADYLADHGRPGPARLFGVPMVATVSEAAGVGHVLATDAVVVDTDTIGLGVQWSETSNSDDFAKNLIRARCEGRFGTSVLSPLGVVSCDLTA